MRSAQPSHDRGAICPFPAGTTDCEPCVTPAKPRAAPLRTSPRLGEQWFLTAPPAPRPLTRARNGGRTPLSSRTGMSGAGSPACFTPAAPGRARRRWPAPRTPQPCANGSSTPRPSTDHSAACRVPGGPFCAAMPEMAPDSDLKTVASANQLRVIMGGHQKTFVSC